MPKKLITAALDPEIDGGLVFYKNQIVKTNIQQFINFFSFSGQQLDEVRPPSIDQITTPTDPVNGFKFIDFFNSRSSEQFVLLEKKFNGDQSKYALMEINSANLLSSLAGNKVTFLDKRPKLLDSSEFFTSLNLNSLTKGYYIFDDNSFSPIYTDPSIEIMGSRTGIIGAFIDDQVTNINNYGGLEIIPHVLLKSDNTLEYYPQTITTHNNAPFKRGDFINLKEYFRLYSPITLSNSLVEYIKSIPNSSFQEIDNSAIQGKTLISLQQDGGRGLALSNNGEVFSLTSSFTPATLRIYQAQHRPSQQPIANTGSVTLTVVSYRENKALTVLPASLNLPSLTGGDYGTAKSQEIITAGTASEFTLIVSQGNYARNNISVPKDWGLSSQQVSEQISRSRHEVDGAGNYVFTLNRDNAVSFSADVAADYIASQTYNHFALSQDPVPYIEEISYTKTITPTLPTVEQQSSLPDYSSISVTVPYSATVQQVEDLLNAAVGANDDTSIPKFKVCSKAGHVWRHPSDLTSRHLRLASTADPRRSSEPFFVPSSTRGAREYAEYQNNGAVFSAGEWDYFAQDAIVITRERLPQETEWVTLVSITNNTIEDPLLFTTYTGAALYGAGATVANRFAGGFRCCHTAKLDADVEKVEHASTQDMLSAQKVFFKWEKINVYNDKAVSKIILQKGLSPSFIFTDGSIFLPYDGLGFFPKSGLLTGKNVIDINCERVAGSIIALILCSDGSLFSVASSADIDSGVMGVSIKSIKITSGKLYPISFSHLKQTKIVKAAIVSDNASYATCYALSETGDVFSWGGPSLQTQFLLNPFGRVFVNRRLPIFFIVNSVTTPFYNVPSYSSLSLPNGLILNKNGDLTGTITSVGDFTAKIKVSVEDFDMVSSYGEPPITTITKSTSDFIDLPIKVLPEPVSPQTVVDDIINPINEYIDPNQNSTGSSTNQVTLFSIPIDLSLLNSRSKLIQLSFTMSRIDTSSPKQQSYRISFGDTDVLDSLLTLSSTSSTLINLRIKINRVSSLGIVIESKFDYSDGTPSMTQSKPISLFDLVNQNITLYATNEAGSSAPIIATKSGPITIG